MKIAPIMKYHPTTYTLLLILYLNNNNECNSFQHRTIPIPSLKVLHNHKRKSISRLFAVRNSNPQTENESSTPESKLDAFLQNNKLNESITHLKTNPSTKLTQSRFINIFKCIEERTSEADENMALQNQPVEGEEVGYYPDSLSRLEMTDMYGTMKELGHLRLYGATREVLPAGGSKVVTPILLEEVTELSMKALTPRPTSTLLIAGIVFGLLEGVASLYLGIDLNVLVVITIIFGLLDKLLVNGAIFETFSRILNPGLSDKILRHEAGHFLIAYLIGCPVEGCVLSSWAALKDARFGGQRNSLSAGTSFFDPDLSDQVNGKKPLSRDSIDRFTMVVMAGIAAEAINFGQADGGAGDEMSLIKFLGQIRPRSGEAKSWTTESIRNQARWGALQSVLMLKEYKKSYEALVDALERGGGLGECIYAIESAARNGGLDVLDRPLGFVLDKGLYGEWSADNNDGGVSNTIQKDASTTTTTATINTNTKLNGSNTATKSSSEEFLKQYRTELEERVKEIDDKLNNL